MMDLDKLWDAIRFCLESKKGKWSLDTYLDIVGQYADRQIIEEKNEGNIYLGGECIVENKGDMLFFEIELYFENSFGEKMNKSANRLLEKSKFIKETINMLETEPMKFEIKEP